ncbi:NUDIX hydrolase [Pseudolabrys sp. FHR47]|uniref:NUDIX hydrolase n=1 Tax=Pseudolabrys sp. FHR47 TaxID=2562284 RepID=UPI0010BEF774|nr:NUDIX hydrolase [Pseudolabrys sp. FHR47]
MAGKTIEAAGGIVVRKDAGKLIAVVQRSKDDAWVLPRGKLKRDENPAAAARREVVEETGHRVEVHEYLGAITYRAGGRPKVVQFWRMEAEPEPSHDLMPDIVAVDWLPLKAAIRRLSYPLEKLFLRHAIARALKKRRVKSKTKAAAGKKKTVKAKKKAAHKAAGNKFPRAQHELKRQAKAAKTKNKSKKKAKNKAKDKAKGKNKSRNKLTKQDRKASKSKMAKGGKSRRDDSRHAIEVPLAAQAPAAMKPTVVATLPPRAPTQPHAAERNGGPRKTILQRVLGRLSG